MMMMVLVMMMEILNGIEITNATDGTKVDFSDCVNSSFNLKLPNLGPGVCRRTEEKHLQGKASSFKEFHLNTSSL